MTASPRPESPPQFCGHCRASSGLQWHCGHPECLWVTCLGCRKLTDVSGLTGTPPEDV